jgi:hypothetical protein
MRLCVLESLCDAFIFCLSLGTKNSELSLPAAIAQIDKAVVRSRPVAVFASIRRRFSHFRLHKFAIVRQPPVFPLANSAASA